MTKKYLDHTPLWDAFPKLLPDDLRSDQGTWYSAVVVWREFWLSLSKPEQATYLDHWSAPREWREAIEYYFTNDTVFDAAKDARESEQHLAKVFSKVSKPSLWKRFFRN